MKPTPQEITPELLSQAQKILARPAEQPDLEDVAVLVGPDHPALWQKAEEVTDIDAQVRPHLPGMMRALMMKGGLGLAAPQVGIALRFFIWRPDGNVCVAVNPTIDRRGTGTTAKLEGCLTWPGREKFVARSNRIEASHVAVGPTGAKYERLLLHNLAARIYQHECDHLDGVCIFPKP